MFRTIVMGAIVLMATFLILPVFAAPTPASHEASVYIISPAHGEVVTNPVTVRFGLKNMGIAPAGVKRGDTGHHHLLIDVAGEPNLHDAVPKDNQHRHFGYGQTETMLTLTPGKHTLQLLLADENHIPHKPAVVSRKIVIYVTE